MAKHPTIPELTGTDVDGDAEPAVIDLADDRTDDLFGALSSATARELFERLRESPTYATELAEQTDTSLQNVHYHLRKLESAGAIEVVDSIYSEKGREMDVYAPTAEPLVIVAGSEDDQQDLVETLSKVLGAIAVLGLGSVAVQKLVEYVFYPGGPTPVTHGSGQYAAPPLTNVAPPVGLYVFIAGLVVLLGWLIWRYR